MTPPPLPPEVLLHIVGFVLPPCSREPVAHKLTSAEARTLVALTLTSRVFYPRAIQLLHSHCLYIDSAQRLRRLLTSLAAQPLPTLLEHRPPTLRPCLTSLYLSPFEDTLDDYPIASWTRELLCLAAPHLRRLVVDMPLRSLYPEDDHLGVRRVLREGFRALEAVEEFVSVRDELYLSTLQGATRQSYVWGKWPRLRRVALYNQDVSSTYFWAALVKLGELEQVVLTRLDGAEETSLWDPIGGRAMREKRKDWTLIKGNLKCLLVDVESGHRDILGEAERREKRLNGEKWQGEDDTMTVQKFNVPVSYYGDENEIELCQDWVKDAAIRRTLWNWEGEVL